MKFQLKRNPNSCVPSKLKNILNLIIVSPIEEDMTKKISSWMWHHKECKITKQCNQGRNEEIWKKSFVSFKSLPSKKMREFYACNIRLLHFSPLQFLCCICHHCNFAHLKHLKINLSMHKNKISSFYNTKPLKS